MDNSDHNPRQALGRGLAALIPPAPTSRATTADPSAPTATGLRNLPIETVRPNPAQPRKTFAAEALSTLAASIRSQGILQPIVVRQVGSSYEIVAGERRWRAAGQAGLQTIPALVKELSDQKAMEIALVENIQRSDLDPLEEAMAYRGLLDDYGLTQEVLAQAVGKSRVTITNSLRLLKLPQPVLNHLAAGKLTAGHARALMTVKDEPMMLRLADDAALRRTSVRDLEAKARATNRSTPANAQKALGTPAERAVEERLMRALSTKVRLKSKKGKGKFEVSFHSYAQLDEILAKIGA